MQRIRSFPMIPEDQPARILENHTFWRLQPQSFSGEHDPTPMMWSPTKEQGGRVPSSLPPCARALSLGGEGLRAAARCPPHKGRLFWEPLGGLSVESGPVSTLSAGDHKDPPCHLRQRHFATALPMRRLSAGDHKGQCHSNKKNLVRKVTSMKGADKIFPGFAVVRKDKRHILGLLDVQSASWRL
jgi:hypothetical protein